MWLIFTGLGGVGFGPLGVARPLPLKVSLWEGRLGRPMALLRKVLGQLACLCPHF